MISVSMTYSGVRALVFYKFTQSMFPSSAPVPSKQISMRYLMNKMQSSADKIEATLVVVHIPYMNRGETNSPPPELLNALTDMTVWSSWISPMPSKNITPGRSHYPYDF